MPEPTWASEDGQVQLYLGDCLEVLPTLAAGSVDAVVTSPPYDNLREYGGQGWDFDGVAPLLYAVLSDGGALVWIVADQTEDGDESGTSFQQALKFKRIGFKLHDTMIYLKGGQGATGSNNAYWQNFEYMFVLTKGHLKTFNPLMDRKNVIAPRTRVDSIGHRYTDGTPKGCRLITRQEYGRRFNTWEYHENGTRIDHPAVFPEKLAVDHILSWTNVGDIVLDNFAGSGTTGVACVQTGRKFIGIEIEEKYFTIAVKRIQEAKMQLRMELS